MIILPIFRLNLSIYSMNLSSIYLYLLDFIYHEIELLSNPLLVAKPENFCIFPKLTIFL